MTLGMSLQCMQSGSYVHTQSRTSYLKRILEHIDKISAGAISEFKCVIVPFGG